MRRSDNFKNQSIKIKKSTGKTSKIKTPKSKNISINISKSKPKKKESGTRKHQKDYNLRKIEDRKKYVDAINKRLKETYNAFGADSKLYKDTVAKLKGFLANDPTMLKEREDGLVYLSKAKKYIEDKKNFTILKKQNYIDKPTVKEFLNQTLQKMKERGEIDEDFKLNQKLEVQGPVTADGKEPVLRVRDLVAEYARQVTQLNFEIREDYTYLYGHEDDSEITDAINTLHITGRRKTKAELDMVLEAIKKAKKMDLDLDEELYKDF